MPLHDFKCQSCGHADEEFRKIHNFAPMENCPKCGELTYMRLISCCHTERDFAKPILFLAKGIHTLAEAQTLLKACPDITMNMEEGHPDWGLPVARNQAGKRQLYKYLGFVEAK
jgi:putative FmdB family regulatory protein